MNKIALCIPRPGETYQMVQQGYVDTLRHLGWKVYCGDPKTKLCCRQWIEEYGIKLIMTHSRYGIRQLPIEIINNNDVMVFIDTLPLNPTNATIDGPYEFAHDDEPDLIKEIEYTVVYTRLEPCTWSKYMCGWENNHISFRHVPAAGNIIRALPSTCSILTDVAMVANFGHRQNIMKRLIGPLFKRLDLLGYSYQAFGDNFWQLAGIDHNGPLTGDVNKLACIYATAKVCPNVHTEKQVVSQAYINERSFMITLCGGLQVSDNPLAAEYLVGEYCKIATSTTDFMNKVIDFVEDQSDRFDQIRAGVSHIAHSHTYFNRLSGMFHSLGLMNLRAEVEEKRQRIAKRHCWEIDTRLSAEERGIPYEQEVIKTS